MTAIKILIKFVGAVVFLTIILFILENGLNFYKTKELLKPLLLAVMIIVAFVKPIFNLSISLKSSLFVVSFMSLLMMVILYALYMVKLANEVGSFGFGLLLVVSSLYLPQLVRHGYITKP